MKNKTRRKILELESEIEDLREEPNCECFIISHLERRIKEYSKEPIVEKEYDPNFDHEEYVKSLKFLYTKNIKLWNPFTGEYNVDANFYECADCGKPFCFQARVAYA